MKILLTFVAIVLFVASVSAQSPEKMSYEAVIRDASNNLVTNQAVGMQISILQGSINGTTVYIETQTPTTNANGLVSIEIGIDTLQSDNFSAIDWSNGPYFIKTETDPTGGTNYSITGISQLLSVPYALHAKSAESIIDENRHYVGELYGGGVVYYVYDDGYHGLIGNVSSTLVGTNGWDGLSNSIAITGQSGHTASAAKLCDDYVSGGFDDWYLPSFWELELLYNASFMVCNILENDVDPLTSGFQLGDVYWSSSEHNATRVWTYLFRSGPAHGSSLKSSHRRVRAIRAF